MKKVLLLFGLFLVLIFGTVLGQNYLKTNNFSFFKKNPEVKINNRNFTVTIASSQKEKEIGLSETKELAENQGMLFTFEKPGFYSFWMKNMKIPIDIIYIKDQKVVTIYDNASPAVSSNENLAIYTPTEPADKVLEIKAGLSKKYNFKKGDKVEYENFSN